MPKDDSAFTWFCTEMTDILEIFQIARKSKSINASSRWDVFSCNAAKKNIQIYFCLKLSRL